MRKILKKLFNRLSFKWSFWLKRLLFNEINEIDIVFNLLKNKKFGVMLDVGAHHGSSLKKFMKLGWEIHAFEPNPANFRHLESATKDFSNVTIYERAVSSESNLELPLYVSDVSSGISGLSKFHESHVESQTIKTISLSDFLADKQVDKIDFLKIDTEGFDLFVLQGFNWQNNNHPEFIICEFEDNKTMPLGYKVGDMISFLEGKSYKVVISEWFPVQEYGQSHTWKRFLKGENHELLNRKSWGNLIAVKDNSKFNTVFFNLINISDI